MVIPPSTSLLWASVRFANGSKEYDWPAVLDQSSPGKFFQTYLLPRLEGITPTISKNVLTNPATTAAVEVEIIRRGVDEFVSSLRNGGNVVRRNPDPVKNVSLIIVDFLKVAQSNSIIGEGNRMIKNHFFPNDGSFPD